MAMSHSAAHLLVALACALLASGASGFHAAPQPQLAARRLAASRATAAAPCMLAKKKSKKREKKGSSGAKPSPVTPMASSPSPPPPAAAARAPPTPGSTYASNADPDAPLNSRLDDVLKNAGISTSADGPLGQAANQKAQSGINPSDPLASIPKAGQVLLERFFGGGAITFGTAFLLSGLAVAVEAICKVTGNPLPQALDEALVQYVEPALTPSILILFAFSISLGLLKQLQLGSETGGVLYIEDDDE